MITLVEHLRREAVQDALSIETVEKIWPEWQKKIQELTPNRTPEEILNLGDRLKEIFITTSQEGRGQDILSAGGVAWESLVCWYMNLCLSGSRTVVLKQKKKLIPDSVLEAMSVYYGETKTNTEADLVCITFPDDPVFISSDANDLEVYNSGKRVLNINKKGDLNYLKLINHLIKDKHDMISINIIQCKTNWNDNAQIPMLWGVIYQIFTQENRNSIGGVVVGTDLLNPSSFKDFTYSFVTVPTQKGERMPKANSMAVNRVKNLSGGNYWGLPSEQDLALSIKEIFQELFIESIQSKENMLSNISLVLDDLDTVYDFFKFPLLDAASH